MFHDFMGPRPVRSAAAFLWMPQFRYSFEHLSHIIPVFMRTLAISFVSAGLLPQNHPATMYGAEGVKRYDFFDLMGEAWFTLRRSNAGPREWGLFVSVALMFAMMVAALTTTLATIALGAGTAQAQLFGLAGKDTSASTMPSPIGGFDQYAYPVDGSGDGDPGHGDYGIMMIDKVFRQGMDAGGLPMQRAVGAMMQTYNTGILVIASVILFWIILSVVVDTAKTGTIGGGRHNMVWAPIRIVFALGLMIPLGATGYSSGQLMVIKMAEWGSNFGTNVWLSYVNAVTGELNMVAKTSIRNDATALAVGLTNIYVCQEAYNAYSAQMGGSDLVGWRVHSDGLKRTAGTSFAPQLCGYYEVYKKPDGSLPFTDDIHSRVSEAKRTIYDAYLVAFIKMTFEARDVACEFVAGFGNTIENPPCTDIASPPTMSETLPTTDAFNAMVADFSTSVQDVYTKEIADLNQYLDDNMIGLMKERGWAGMGGWYHIISEINSAMHSMQDAPMDVVPSDLQEGLAKLEGVAEGGGYMGNFVANFLKTDGAQVIRNTVQVTTAFDRWWATTGTTGITAATIMQGTGEDDNTVAVEDDDDEAKSNYKEKVKGKTKKKVFESVSSDHFKSGDGWLLALYTDAIDPNGESSDTYPLAMLANTGSNIMITGGVMLGGALAVAWIPFIGGTLANIATQLGMPLLVAGIVLKVYVPLIPFMRATMAVLTWIISVFEAVALVPIAALAHLTTEGHGLMPQGARVAWMAWLNVLIRPALTAVAFVGAMLVFNSFTAFFNHTFVQTIKGGISGEVFLLSEVGYAIVYVFVLYSAANSIFKMLDLIPNAAMSYMGGKQESSFDNINEGSMMVAASNMMRGMGKSYKNKKPGGKSEDTVNETPGG